jgi:hypothetical protein
LAAPGRNSASACDTLLCEGRSHLEQVANDAEISQFEDGRVGVLVDGRDCLEGLHAGELLDGAGDADLCGRSLMPLLRTLFQHRKRTTSWATQTGLLPPSRSTTASTVSCAPPGMGSTADSVAVARTLDPAGTGAGKRTRFRP